MICPKSKSSMSLGSLGVRCVIVRQFLLCLDGGGVPLGIFNRFRRLCFKSRPSERQGTAERPYKGNWEKSGGSSQFARGFMVKETSDHVTYLTPTRSANPLCS